MITDEGDAVQFLASTTTVTAFHNRPVQNPRVEGLIEYTLKAEIQTTAKDGAYYGTAESIGSKKQYCKIASYNSSKLPASLVWIVKRHQ